MCTKLYNMTQKGCTTKQKRFEQRIVRSCHKHCTIHCTLNYELLYIVARYVQYLTKPCTIFFSNQFFNCTIFQLVLYVQPFVKYCTMSVQYCSILYRLYRLYNLLYNIVTVWFADVDHYIPAFYFPNQKVPAHKDCRIWLD
jgi:hypothetical protein